MRSVTVQPTLSEPHRNLQHVLPGDLLILHAEDDLGDLWIRGEGSASIEGSGNRRLNWARVIRWGIPCNTASIVRYCRG